MGLEEHTLEELEDHCEVCGTQLTADELASALESGGPALCTVHATEVLALDDDEAGDA
jgi:hypothetical protein